MPRSIVANYQNYKLAHKQYKNNSCWLNSMMAQMQKYGVDYDEKVMLNASRLNYATGKLYHENTQDGTMMADFASVNGQIAGDQNQSSDLLHDVLPDKIFCNFNLDVVMMKIAMGDNFNLKEAADDVIEKLSKVIDETQSPISFMRNGHVVTILGFDTEKGTMILLDSLDKGTPVVPKEMSLQEGFYQYFDVSKPISEMSFSWVEDIVGKSKKEILEKLEKNQGVGPDSKDNFEKFKAGTPSNVNLSNSVPVDQKFFLSDKYNGTNFANAFYSFDPKAYDQFIKMGENEAFPQMEGEKKYIKDVSTMPFAERVGYRVGDSGSFREKDVRPGMQLVYASVQDVDQIVGIVEHIPALAKHKEINALIRLIKQYRSVLTDENKMAKMGKMISEHDAKLLPDRTDKMRGQVDLVPEKPTPERLIVTPENYLDIALSMMNLVHLELQKRDEAAKKDVSQALNDRDRFLMEHVEFVNSVLAKGKLLRVEKRDNPFFQFVMDFANGADQLSEQEFDSAIGVVTLCRQIYLDLARLEELGSAVGPEMEEIEQRLDENIAALVDNFDIVEPAIANSPAFQNMKKNGLGMGQQIVQNSKVSMKPEGPQVEESKIEVRAPEQNVAKVDAPKVEVPKVEVPVANEDQGPIKGTVSGYEKMALPHVQKRGLTCWANGMSLLLQKDGIQVNEDQVVDATIINSMTDSRFDMYPFEMVTNELEYSNGFQSGDIQGNVDVYHDLKPDSALCTFTFQKEQGLRKEGKKDQFYGDVVHRMAAIIRDTDSPIVFNEGGHFLTILSIDEAKDELIVIDSDKEDQIKPTTMKISERLGKVIREGNNFSVSWREDLRGKSKEEITARIVDHAPDNVKERTRKNLAEGRMEEGIYTTGSGYSMKFLQGPDYASDSNTYAYGMSKQAFEAYSKMGEKDVFPELKAEKKLQFKPMENRVYKPMPDIMGVTGRKAFEDSQIRDKQVGMRSIYISGEDIGYLLKMPGMLPEGTDISVIEKFAERLQEYGSEVLTYGQSLRDYSNEYQPKLEGDRVTLYRSAVFGDMALQFMAMLQDRMEPYTEQNPEAWNKLSAAQKAVFGHTRFMMDMILQGKNINFERGKNAYLDAYMELGNKLPDVARTGNTALCERMDRYMQLCKQCSSLLGVNPLTDQQARVYAELIKGLQRLQTPELMEQLGGVADGVQYVILRDGDMLQKREARIQAEHARSAKVDIFADHMGQVLKLGKAYKDADRFFYINSSKYCALEDAIDDMNRFLQENGGDIRRMNRELQDLALTKMEKIHTTAREYLETKAESHTTRSTDHGIVRFNSALAILDHLNPEESKVFAETNMEILQTIDRRTMAEAKISVETMLEETNVQIGDGGKLVDHYRNLAKVTETRANLISDSLEQLNVLQSAKIVGQAPFVDERLVVSEGLDRGSVMAIDPPMELGCDKVGELITLVRYAKSVSEERAIEITKDILNGGRLKLEELTSVIADGIKNYRSQVVSRRQMPTEGSQVAEAIHMGRAIRDWGRANVTIERQVREQFGGQAEYKKNIYETVGYSYLATEYSKTVDYRNVLYDDVARNADSSQLTKMRMIESALQVDTAKAMLKNDQNFLEKWGEDPSLVKDEVSLVVRRQDMEALAEQSGKELLRPENITAKLVKMKQAAPAAANQGGINPQGGIQADNAQPQGPGIK